ncbi:hypothetical protein E1Z16_12750 [Listeria monocytogenes]|uniref:Uncharacterized protein n=3 Tax=Listeria monocytogenes TaxID=1639 RepID=A0A830MFS9_LISMN|nr:MULTISPECIES: hypothetical protein [Listeria]EAC2322375.1 hypothetical protein [Listeria monocytogenes]EAC2332067.1 hypothetical protein [Listeria monocytogenes]EAC2620941.1 hypothetical protein [Listeria monocytogenes]EAC2699967.1 hypothetical protein [Listeria monocytogenes]EAC2735956.1 hypothetical protein [Listeria monocytogenes]
MKKWLFVFLCICFLSQCLSSTVFAEESDQKIAYLYQKGIAEGKIASKQYSYDAFKENYETNQATYLALKDEFNTSTSYDEWFAETCNYGAFPDGEGHAASERKIETRSANSNGNRLKDVIRKGDILIVNSSVFGHAAIATTDNYILEMSGNQNIVSWFVGGIANNNHQFTKQHWIFGTSNEQGARSSAHISDWIQVWRLPNQDMAKKCADYADFKFWSSTHSYTKNRHITYRLTSGTLTFDPNYCSKMVFQSYYFGSGSASVLQGFTGGLSSIAPKALPNLFTAAYKPYKVGTY